MYLTVSIGPSHMESSTELIKKFFFQWSPQFSAFEPPNKSPPNRYMSYQRPTTLPLSPETTLGDTSTQSLITNFPSFSPSQYTELQFRSPQTRFTDSQKQYFSLLAPTSYYKVVNFSPQVSLNVNRTIISLMGYRTPRLTHLPGRQGKHL